MRLATSSIVNMYATKSIVTLIEMIKEYFYTRGPEARNALMPA